MTPESLPKGLPLGDSVINEATVPFVVKDKAFAQQWPVPWPQAENAYGGGPVQCEGLESTIRDVWARMKEASQEKKSPN
jgi:hypothetical protein